MQQEAVTGDFGELVRLLLEHGGKIWDARRGQVMCSCVFAIVFPVAECIAIGDTTAHSALNDQVSLYSRKHVASAQHQS